MRYYETLYLIDPNLSEEDYRDTLDRYNGILEKSGAVIVKVDEWGKRTLAYPVRKNDKGIYVLLLYCGDGGVTAPLHKSFSLDERILKYQTIKLRDNVDPEEVKLALAKESAPLEETTEAAEAAQAETPAQTGE